MTAVRLVQITCDCDCTRLPTPHGCLHSHPDPQPSWTAEPEEVPDAG